ncbi:hypothetical protein Psta_4580 [Pirellula staleyi DSM 6068]|uniref:Uncharacterized protein n=1 Tax=Pirellula staleyi (strain ATCC 27377 / DSM 6068 / ICPB 4128) TaxID=530564 RepID=D2R719_PIRSD|nr:hypothetical protein Psta_4580 [Pirellula staleyi DSM 6068]
MARWQARVVIHAAERSGYASQKSWVPRGEMIGYALGDRLIQAFPRPGFVRSRCLSAGH